MLRNFWQLQRQQWFAPAQLAALQRGRLREIIAYTYERVPYYRRLFDRSGLRPGDIATPEDLRKLPVLSRETLQRESRDSLAEGVDPEQCLVKKTSGSGGKPLEIRRTKPEDYYRRLVWARANIANGLRPWHKQALILERNLPQKEKIWLDRIRHVAGLQKLYLWCGDDVHRQIEALRSYRPDVIIGYSQSLRLLAHTLKQSGINDISPRTIFSSAELLEPQTRALICEVFGLKVVDMYVSVEGGCIAWECPEHHGYHLNTDSLVVEFLRNGEPAAPGEPGHVVVTPLYARAMPLIRYDLGDIATPMDEQCPCGRGLPLMRMIHGRSDDFVTLRSGTVIYPVGTFADIMEKEPAIIEFFVIQEEYDLVIVKLVTVGEPGPAMVERVRSEVEELLHHEAVVKVEVLDEIERAHGPKLRRIISKIPINF